MEGKAGYLSKSGYVVYKNTLDKGDIRKIKKELRVKPFVVADFDYPGNPLTKPFNVYNENSNKYYLPKFKGIEIFGKPRKNKIPDGEDIDITFTGKMRDYQREPVEKAIEACRTTGGGILSLPKDSLPQNACNTVLPCASFSFINVLIR